MKRLKQKALALLSIIALIAPCITPMSAYAGNIMQIGEFTMQDWTYGDTPSSPTGGGGGINIEYTYYVGEVTAGSLTLTTTKTSASNGATETGGKPAYPGTYTVEEKCTMTNHNDPDPLSATTTTYHYDTFQIHKRSVSLDPSSTSVQDKVYDGTTHYNGRIVVNGFLTSDRDQLTMTTSFADKNAGSNKPLSISITGAAADRYDLSSLSNAVTANITPKIVTITGTRAYDKEYDGTTSGTVLNAGRLQGVIDGDDVEIVEGNATFEDSQVGNNKTVTFDGFALTGSDASNYTLSSQPSPTTASIVRASSYIVTLNEDAFVYNKTECKPTVTVKAGGETVDPSTYTVTYKNNINAGTAQVIVKGSGTSSDLNITKEFSITKAPLTVTAKDATKTYGASDPAFAYEVSGLMDGDLKDSVFGGKLSRDAGEDVGDYTIKQGTLSCVGNYTFTYKPANLSITKATTSNKTVPTVNVKTTEAEGEKINLGKYLEKGAALEDYDVTGDMASYITINDLDGTSLDYDITDNDAGTEGTITLTVSSTNYENYTITIPVESTNKTTSSTLTEGTGFASAITVKGLEDYTKAQTGDTVDVKLTAKPIDSAEITSSILESIKAKAKTYLSFIKKDGDIGYEFFDIDVTRSVNNEDPDEITDLGRVVEIELTCDLTNKIEPVVIREHGGNVTTMTKLKARPTSNYKDATFYTNGKDKVYIYTRYFSTYTVAYSKVEKTNGSSTTDTKTTTTTTKTTTDKKADTKKTATSNTTGTNNNNNESLTGTLVAPKTGNSIVTLVFWIILSIAGILTVIFALKKAGKKVF